MDFATFSIPTGTHTIRVSMFGYEDFTWVRNVDKSTTLEAVLASIEAQTTGEQQPTGEQPVNTEQLVVIAVALVFLVALIVSQKAGR